MYAGCGMGTGWRTKSTSPATDSSPVVVSNESGLTHHTVTLSHSLEAVHALKALAQVWLDTGWVLRGNTTHHMRARSIHNTIPYATLIIPHNCLTVTE